nr:UPF0175 family protein [Candidatus Sigynarchaeota archaeon]
MGRSITSRLPDDLVKEIEKISEAEHLDKSSVVRRLLARAIAEWNLENAVNAFQQGKASLGQATSLSNVSIWEFLDELRARKIPLHYDLEDFQDDLKTIAEARNA